MPLRGFAASDAHLWSWFCSQTGWPHGRCTPSEKGQSMSFPSGHAANSALVYLTIAALASDVEPGRSARIYIMAVAMTLTILIGLSRLYLCVHWPSDVAAGWALGAGWALAWRLAAARYLWSTS
ncbi:phosphatase PAP2 family protein [Novosphingobium sp.]|uniref:phosphatase PAP2 family protein n=1 Tax=Novosphingobium sp. TaxID=1874826 RepID=UPI00262B2DAF|nr:phosphatase PAP2 family protein [Novosphingobium sp.]